MKGGADTSLALRANVRHFLDDHWAPLRARGHLSEGDKRDFLRRAVEHGLVYTDIPRAYGGAERELDVLEKELIREEFYQVGAPNEFYGVGVGLVVPTLMEWGTEAQKRFFIERTLFNEFRWAQGFSEPNAGSDLAALTTSAELQRGRWVINGQKIWSSRAHENQLLVLIVRTAKAERKHQGLSFLLVQIDQPEITVQPLRQMTGRKEFCQLFFDNATTPADWILGNPGDGWKVTKSMLTHEKGFMGDARLAERYVTKLLALACQPRADGTRPIDTPTVRDRLATLDGFVKAITMSTARQTAMNRWGQDPGRFTYLRKLVMNRIEQDVATLARDLSGSDMMLMPPGEYDERDERMWEGPQLWRNQFMRSLAVTIAGGTSNMHRSMTAEHGLKLGRW